MAGRHDRSVRARVLNRVVVVPAGTHQSPIRIKALGAIRLIVSRPLAHSEPQKTVGARPCPIDGPSAGRPTGAWLRARGGTSHFVARGRGVPVSVHVVTACGDRSLQIPTFIAAEPHCIFNGSGSVYRSRGVGEGVPITKPWFEVRHLVAPIVPVLLWVFAGLRLRL